MPAAGTIADNPRVDAPIRAALRKLRWRIRAYVALQGLAAVVLWLGATFWAAFALDYLPVLLGASEMPRWARGLILVAVTIGAAAILWRMLLARLFVPLADRSLALLVERQQAGFRDSLITTVELAGDLPPATDALTRELLRETRGRALEQLGGTRLGRVFNYGPLARNVLLALAVAGSMVAAGRVNADALGKAARRLYLLDDELWERFARIHVVGAEVRRGESSGVAPQELAFHEGLIKVARGSNVSLKVQADAEAPVLPEQCYLNYRTAEGDTGSVTVKKVGRVKDGFQTYLCDAKPLAGILSTLDFDVLGYDHRLGGFRIEVVDSPAIVSATMDLRYPGYMVDEAHAIRLPREGEPVLAAGNPIPRGTAVTLHFTSSKPLVAAEVRVLDPNAADAATLEVERRQLKFSSEASATRIAFEIPSLLASRNLEVTLTDADGVASERPFRTFLTAIADDPPRWEVALRGIGNVVTPDARLPLAGKVTDDYGVSRMWIDARVGDTEPETFSIDPPRGSEFSYVIDLRDERNSGERLVVEPGQRLTLLGRALDACDLAGGPNEGVSERLVLEVVTPDQLLATIDARELALRRRFEVILEELTAMRDSLLRVKPSVSASSPDLGEPEPGEQKLTPQELARREAELRVLRVQRAFQQSKKSSQEIAGVAMALDGICDELTNNRVDTEDRKVRLQEQIASPLRQVLATDFPKLDDQLLALEPLLGDAAASGPAVDATVVHTNDTLAKLEQILQKMLKLESYNEVVDLLRDLIREEQSLTEDTRRQQRRDLLEE
jgi:hypothetical protein